MTEKWEPEEARKLRAQARDIFARHQHPTEFDSAEDEELTRTNCGACVVAGYAPVVADRGEHVAPEPNYAGWARVYVQAGRPIPQVFREAFEDARVDENTRYAAGLARDIATFGVQYESTSQGA